jgi:hypothetical protein
VVDDEPLVVIDNATGRGYRLTISGVGDNHQLHTLLADRLIGDPEQGMVPGERPVPEWVAAATTGPSEVEAGIQRRFRLYDGAGTYIYPEGKPADIVQIDGARVIVLYPPRGNFRWLHGRTYLGMIPAMTLDAVMTAGEAAAWRGRITPARETDVFARNPELPVQSTHRRSRARARTRQRPRRLPGSRAGQAGDRVMPGEQVRLHRPRLPAQPVRQIY